MAAYQQKTSGFTRPALSMSCYQWGCRDKCGSWIISPQTSGHTLSMLILSACLPCRPELWQLYLLDRDVNRQDSCNYRTGAKTISTYQQEQTQNWHPWTNQILILDRRFRLFWNKNTKNTDNKLQLRQTQAI